MLFDTSKLYIEPVFRPPAEAHSVIVQATHGCGWNGCHFCEMYKGVRFYKCIVNEIDDHIYRLQQLFPDKRKIFIGDGDFFSMSFNEMLHVIEAIKMKWPRYTRISAYASAKGISKFSIEELRQLRQAGLSLLYVGVESGSDKVLKLMNKGVNSAQQVNALKLAKEAGFKLSVMILTGLGGKELMQEHAVESARVINQIQPALLSLLVLSFPYGLKHFTNKLSQSFTPLKPLETLKEIALFMKETNLESTVFRADHASNYLPIKGGLGKDKDAIIKGLQQIISSEDKSILKNEWERGL